MLPDWRQAAALDGGMMMIAMLGTRLTTPASRRSVRKLREADRLLAEGADVAAVARHLEISEPTYHRWRAQYGGMKADDAKRLKELEAENARLWVDKLAIDALREIARGNW